MKKIFLFLIVLQIITYAQTEKKSWSDYKNLVKDSVTASEARVKNAIKDSITANSQGFQKASDVSGLIADSLTSYARKGGDQTFTGNNTFSSNKTIFGTTTNDSVGIRGNLKINGTTTTTGLNVSGTSNIKDIISIGGSYQGLGLTALSLPLSITNFDISNSLMGGIRYSNNNLKVGYVNTEANPLFNSQIKFYSDSLKISAKSIKGTDDTLRLNGVILLNNNVLSIGGSVSNADSLGGLPASAYTLNSNLNNWTTNLSSGSGTQLRLGKSYNDKRFNNGAYSDVWNIDYVIPPYNLSADWLNPIEHRVDYYNDTLQTVSGVANLLNIDGTGTPLWKTNDVNISGQQTTISVGDLPDSTTLNWNNTGLFGSKITLSEENLTATPKRFPMKVKGYSFNIGTNSYYTYPELYSYYSNLSSGNLEKAYHFYGEGNYPSYFGGTITVGGSYTLPNTDGSDGQVLKTNGSGTLTWQDDLNSGSVTPQEVSDSISSNASQTYGGERIFSDNVIIDQLAAGQFMWRDGSNYQTLAGQPTQTSETIYLPSNKNLETLATRSDISDSLSAFSGGIDSATVNKLIQDWADSVSSTLTITADQIDSSITALKGGSTSQVLTKNSNTDFDYSWATPTGGSTFDSTYVYQRITALEDSIGSLRTTLNAILTVLDSLGYAPNLSDNTPPTPPTSYVAIGGTSQTQYVSTWTDPTATDLAKIYWYEGSANDTTTLVLVDSISAGVQTYTRTGRTANTTYWSAVKAVDDSGNVSYFSNLDSATTAPTSGATPIAVLDFGEGRVVYNTEGILDQVKERLGITGDLTPELDAYGEDRLSTYRRFPIPHQEKVDKIADLLLKTGNVIGTPSNPKIQGKEVFDKDQYNSFIKEYKQNMYKALNRTYDLLERLQNQGEVGSMTLDRLVSAIKTESRELAKIKVKENQ